MWWEDTSAQPLGQGDVVIGIRIPRVTVDPIASGQVDHTFIDTYRRSTQTHFMIVTQCCSLKNGYIAVAPIEVRPADPRIAGSAELLKALRDKVGKHGYEHLAANDLFATFPIQDVDRRVRLERTVSGLEKIPQVDFNGILSIRDTDQALLACRVRAMKPEARASLRMKLSLFFSRMTGEDREYLHEQALLK